MSRNYDNWERLVGAVLRREKDRRLAYCESFCSSSSAGLSSRFSFVGDVHESSDLCSANIFFSRDVKAMEYNEIRKTTSNFRADSMLRGGPYSRNCVYKGWIDENYVAAVKPGSGVAVAVTVRHDEGQGIAYWLEEKIHFEINFGMNLSQCRHPNLVIPIGYYADIGKTIFVNEFMARGSLDRYLDIEQEALPWATRMRVAVGAARGLAFLHNLEIPSIYGVLTSRDILLDATGTGTHELLYEGISQDFNAKLSDFGIAKDYFHYATPDEIEGLWSHVQTIRVEYERYAAPEFVKRDSSSTKCDVYSFGIVLQDLMSGLLAGKQPREWQNLIMDLGKKIRLSRIMDSSGLEGEYPPKEAYKVAHIARQCVSQDPRSRPTMAEVVAALEKP